MARQRNARSREDAIIAAGGMSPREIRLVLVGLMAAMFLSSLSQSVVGTAMRTIADDLNGLSQQAWVATAFLIVSTIVTPIYGKLSDLFGRRPLFIIAIVLFLVGSVACSFADSMIGLALWRALQGLGAGGLMSLPLAIMGDILNPRERAKYQGFFLAIFGFSSLLGPLVGGIFAGADTILGLQGWRWVFLFNLPLGLAALWMVARWLHIPRHGHGKATVDWWGATALVVGVVPLLLVAEQGREWGWGSVPSVACYVVGAIGLVAFVLIERAMGENAIIPLALFRSSAFSMATVISVLVGFGMFAGMMMIPFLLQIVHGMDPTTAGFAMFPMIVGLMLASIGSGQIMARTGHYRSFPLIGTVVMMSGFVVIAALPYDAPYGVLAIGQFLAGFGLGGMLQTLTIATQNSVEPKDMGVATSSATFFRQLGGTAGTAAVFSILYSRLPDTIASAFGDPTLRADLEAATQDPAVIADPANTRILDVLAHPETLGEALNGDSSFLNGADPALSAPFLQGFTEATATAFWVAAAIIAVAFVLAQFFRPPALRQRSAMEETLAARRAAEAELSDRATTGAIVTPTAAERAAATATASGSPATDVHVIDDDGVTPDAPDAPDESVRD